MRSGTRYSFIAVAFAWVALVACSAGKSPTGSELAPRGTAGGPSQVGTAGGDGSSGSGDLNTVGGGPEIMTYTNPCDAADAPANCQVTADPGCGDGIINQKNEECDDGNSLPGDGCSGICKIEPYFSCPTPGKLCVSTIVCGDGIVGAGEACDDSNTVSGDGCAADCRTIEKGYVCRTPGVACEPVHSCGDGVTNADEGCDDGNNTAADGCNARCQIEPGFKCSGSPSVCVATVCGDNVKEGAESCDDGNLLAFDGCSGTCQLEPDCSSTSGCTSACGDGIVLGDSEQCDDGNQRDGDGCSSKCQIEPGFVCASNPCVKAANGICTQTIPAVFRDLASSTDVRNINDPLHGADGNPDFEPSYDNQPIIKGLLATTLGADGAPVLIAPGALPGFIHSAASFSQWYHNAPPNNAAFPGSIVLWDKSGTGAGPYVNRWGVNGEQWPVYTQINPCVAGTPGIPLGNPQPCTSLALLDGNPVFFPIDNPTAPPSLIPETRYPAQIPAQVYNGGWAAEPGGALHNFHFTTQVRYWFKYDPALAATLKFIGDDDVWVYVNRTLALDLGGWHPPLEGSFTLDATAATTYGLVSGNVYEIDVFHAERKTTGSSFQLTLSGFDLAPSTCTPQCGDSVVSPGETCDNGAANDDSVYGGCTTQCVLGPRCGDGVVQMPDEACDDGTNTGAYGTCAANCQLGPHCGDGVVQTDHEKCDDGTNTGAYGMCAPGCVFGPRCGDGVVQADAGETCDDGNNVSGDGCSAACKLEQVR